MVTVSTIWRVFLYSNGVHVLISWENKFPLIVSIKLEIKSE